MMINVYNIDILTRPDIEVQVVVLTASYGIYSFISWSGCCGRGCFCNVTLFSDYS